jgi:MoaA/NifB/PqqE/SkfB family radical SAM enzyme
MLHLNDIAGINVEVSARCNARCPFCSRNKKVRSYGNHLLTLADFKKLPEKLFESLEWVSFGGNFGDPSTNPELPQISEYFKAMCPAVTLMADTNGSVQNSQWWRTLGPSFSNGIMYFSVDGLGDTNANHRKGTDFNKITENIAAFTNGGGVAYWKFILFEHNKHQVDEAEKTAKELGCTRFFVISSREYNNECERPGNTTFQIKEEIFAAYRQKTIEQNEQALCKPLQNHSIYLAADGTVHPCCLAHCNFITEHEPSFEFIIGLIEKNLDQINFKTRPLEDILGDSYFNDVLEISKSNSYCMMKCNKHRKKAIEQLILHDTYF